MSEAVQLRRGSAGGDARTAPAAPVSAAEMRAALDAAFWRGEEINIGHRSLRAALLRGDGEAVRLMIACGVRLDAEDMGVMQAAGPEKHARASALLRRAGVRAPEAGIWAFVYYMEEILEEVLLPRIPEEWKRVLSAAQKKSGGGAVIAGGALRDLFNVRAVRDVDIFVLAAAEGRDRPDRFDSRRAFLKSVFRAAGLKVWEQEVSYMYEDGHFPDPVDHLHKTGLESWTVVAGQDRTEYNVIFAPDEDNAMDLLGRFDIGLCRVAWDGQEFYTRADFRHDMKDKTITLCTKNPDWGHVARVVRKYPDFTPCKRIKGNRP